MGALFTAASSQYLSNATPFLVSTGYPFAIGTWLRLNATGTQRAVFAYTDTATTNNFLEFRVLSTGILSVGAAAGGTTISTDLTTALTANAWTFAIARCLSATIIRLSQLLPDGTVQHAGGTVTSRAPTGLDMLTVGGFKTSAAAAEFWDGLIGELWYTNTDIGLDSAASLPDPLVRQLAWGGPFSVLNVAKNIVEYHSYFDDVITPEIGQDYTGAGAPAQTWVNNAGVGLGIHPPLPYWYARPGQTKRKLMV